MLLSGLGSGVWLLTWALLTKDPVSYTHLDVYKRQRELRAAIGATNGDISAIGYSARPPIEGLDDYTYAISRGANTETTPVNHTTAVLEADGSNPSRVQPYIVARYIYKIK